MNLEDLKLAYDNAKALKEHYANKYYTLIENHMRVKLLSEQHLERIEKLEAENARLKEIELQSHKNVGLLNSVMSDLQEARKQLAYRDQLITNEYKYEKLKKLDENVKREIERLNALPILTNPEERILQTLESLYNE